LEILSLKYLLAVAESGSFAGAARQLDLHASTLSRHIFAVEEELGTTIFEREHSGVRLTSSGHEVLVYVRQTLSDLDALAKIGQSSGTGKHGRVGLGVHIQPLSPTLTALLARWRQFHPNVELTLHELPGGELCKAVRDKHIDVAIMGEHALDPEFVSEKICGERLFAGVLNRSLLAHAEAAQWSALRKEIVLVQDWPNSHIVRSFYGSLLGHGARLRSHPASKQAVLALVAAGFGITLVTESQANVGFPGVTFVPIAEENAFVNIVLAWRPQSEDPAVGRFIAFMRDEACSLRIGSAT
jgi:DNA-binding transcriptional LysR family regulator